jgi:LmbE family N-acetylglucosaminyl deacetylase
MFQGTVKLSEAHKPVWLSRLLPALSALLLLLSFCSGNAALGSSFQPAEDLTKAVSLSISTKAKTGVLSDSNTSTKLTLPQGAVIEIGCPEGKPIHSLYLVWDKPPGPWILITPRGEETGGIDNFLHEYVPITGGADYLTLILLDRERILCDLYAYGEGVPPERVQIWKPPYDKADLLLLSTHADDEHLYFGGTMPYYGGELGLRVQVSYLVNHWTEPYRPHELLNGLWTVGIDHYPVIGPYYDHYTRALDHARTLFPEDEIILYQISLLRRFKPLVVIGHDIKGEYGHGAHMLNAVTLITALEASGDPSADPGSAALYGVWDVPKTYLHLYGDNKVVMNWDRPLERFGGATAFEMAVKGFACHGSQVRYFSVQKSGAYDCRLFGLYRSDRGPDLAGGDFMEGLAPYTMERYDYGHFALHWFDAARFKGASGKGFPFGLMEAR